METLLQDLTELGGQAVIGAAVALVLVVIHAMALELAMWRNRSPKGNDNPTA